MATRAVSNSRRFRRRHPHQRQPIVVPAPGDPNASAFARPVQLAVRKMRAEEPRQLRFLQIMAWTFVAVMAVTVLVLVGAVSVAVWRAAH